MQVELEEQLLWNAHLISGILTVYWEQKEDIDIFSIIITVWLSEAICLLCVNPWIQMSSKVLLFLPF